MTWIGVLIIVGLLGLLALSYFVLVPLRIKSAMKKLIRGFQKLNAVGESLAVTEKELGIQRGLGLFRFNMLRDYTPQALDLMVQAGVVQRMPDSKIFLVEKNLGLLNFWRPKQPQELN